MTWLDSQTPPASGSTESRSSSSTDRTRTGAPQTRFARRPPRTPRAAFLSAWQQTALAGAGLLLAAVVLWGPSAWRARHPASDLRPPPLVEEASAQSAPAPPATPAAESPPSDRTQGPALTAPREIFTMLNQRRRHLDERERALQAEQARLGAVKQEIEALLARHEATLKKLKEAQQQRTAKAAATQEAEAQREREAQRRAAAEEEAEQARAKQVAKIYEAMPPEDAATRMEKLPAKTALRVLRLLKSRAAGNILAQVNPDKAAKLTEQYLSQ